MVQQALQAAWKDSLPNDPMRRHEEGGWIYMDTTTGELTTRRQEAGPAMSSPWWLLSFLG